MELITDFLAEWGYLALFVTMVLENMNIPIPSEIVLGFAGFLVSQDIFSFWPTVIVGTAAGVTGSLGSYWIGAKGGRTVLLKYGQHMHLSSKKLIAADSWFQRYGGIAVFTGRLLPGIRTFISSRRASPSTRCPTSRCSPSRAPSRGPSSSSMWAPCWETTGRPFWIIITRSPRARRPSFSSFLRCISISAA